MSTETIERAASTHSATEDHELGHGYCALCYPPPSIPSIAVCGTPWTEGCVINNEPPKDPCAVCYNGEPIRCNGCGVLLEAGK